MIRNSNDETNFPHKLLLTNKQVSKFRKAFTNSWSANINFSKNQLPEMINSGGILGELLVALPYTAFKAGMQQIIKTAPELTKYATKYIVYKGLDRLKKDFSISEGSKKTLKNNEIKDILNEVSLYKIEEFYQKKLLEKLLVKKEDFQIFLDH